MNRREFLKRGAVTVVPAADSHHRPGGNEANHPGDRGEHLNGERATHA